MPNPISGKCIAHAMESSRTVQYFPGCMFNMIYDEKDRQSLLDINLADVQQRKMVWLKTPRGKWVIDFDRANASDTPLRIFFCGECGQPFDRLNDIGTHSNAEHNKGKKAAKQAQADNEAEEEARLLAEAEESAAKLKADNAVA